jgi:hypothetical protein
MTGPAAQDRGDAISAWRVFQVMPDPRSIEATHRWRPIA